MGHIHISLRGRPNRRFHARLQCRARVGSHHDDLGARRVLQGRDTKDFALETLYLKLIDGEDDLLPNFERR